MCSWSSFCGFVCLTCLRVCWIVLCTIEVFRFCCCALPSFDIAAHQLVKFPTRLFEHENHTLHTLWPCNHRMRVAKETGLSPLARTRRTCAFLRRVQVLAHRPFAWATSIEKSAMFTTRNGFSRCVLQRVFNAPPGAIFGFSVRTKEMTSPVWNSVLFVRKWIFFVLLALWPEWCAYWFLFQGHHRCNCFHFCAAGTSQTFVAPWQLQGTIHWTSISRVYLWRVTWAAVAETETVAAQMITVLHFTSTCRNRFLSAPL